MAKLKPKPTVIWRLTNKYNGVLIAQVTDKETLKRLLESYDGPYTPLIEEAVLDWKEIDRRTAKRRTK